jgi:hypothetical protein
MMIAHIPPAATVDPCCCCNCGGGGGGGGGWYGVRCASARMTRITPRTIHRTTHMTSYISIESVDEIWRLRSVCTCRCGERAVSFSCHQRRKQQAHAPPRKEEEEEEEEE